MAVACLASVLALAACSDDDEPASRATVPREPIDPPSARVVAADPRDARTLGEASRPSSGDPGDVSLAEPRLRGITIGEDGNEGVARVRVSVTETIRCRRSGGRAVSRPRTRYYPPPQVIRVRSNPGARIPTRRTRSVLIRLWTTGCREGSELEEVNGELWGEAINGSGLEAVTPHLRFRYQPR